MRLKNFLLFCTFILFFTARDVLTEGVPEGITFIVIKCVKDGLSFEKLKEILLEKDTFTHEHIKWISKRLGDGEAVTEYLEARLKELEDKHGGPIQETMDSLLEEMTNPTNISEEAVKGLQYVTPWKERQKSIDQKASYSGMKGIINRCVKPIKDYFTPEVLKDQLAMAYKFKKFFQDFKHLILNMKNTDHCTWSLYVEKSLADSILGIRDLCTGLPLKPETKKSIDASENVIEDIKISLELCKKNHVSYDDLNTFYKSLEESRLKLNIDESGISPLICIAEVIYWLLMEFVKKGFVSINGESTEFAMSEEYNKIFIRKLDILIEIFCNELKYTDKDLEEIAKNFSKDGEDCKNLPVPTSDTEWMDLCMPLGRIDERRKMGSIVDILSRKWDVFKTSKGFNEGIIQTTESLIELLEFINILVLRSKLEDGKRFPDAIRNHCLFNIIKRIVPEDTTYDKLKNILCLLDLFGTYRTDSESLLGLRVKVYDFKDILNERYEYYISKNDDTDESIVDIMLLIDILKCLYNLAIQVFDKENLVKCDDKVSGRFSGKSVYNLSLILTGLIRRLRESQEAFIQSIGNLVKKSDIEEISSQVQNNLKSQVNDLFLGGEDRTDKLEQGLKTLNKRVCVLEQGPASSVDGNIIDKKLQDIYAKLLKSINDLDTRSSIMARRVEVLDRIVSGFRMASAPVADLPLAEKYRQRKEERGASKQEQPILTTRDSDLPPPQYSIPRGDTNRFLDGMRDGQSQLYQRVGETPQQQNPQQRGSGGSNSVLASTSQSSGDKPTYRPRFDRHDKGDD